MGYSLNPSEKQINFRSECFAGNQFMPVVEGNMTTTNSIPVPAGVMVGIEDQDAGGPL
jgi:hypothetical protein